MSDDAIKSICLESIDNEKNRYRLYGLFIYNYGIGGYLLLRVRCRKNFKYLSGIKQIFWNLDNAETAMDNLAKDKIQKRGYIMSSDNDIFESVDMQNLISKSNFAADDRNKKSTYLVDKDRYVTLEDLSALTGYSHSTVSQITRRGIPFMQKKSGKKYYNLSHFWRWVDKNRSKIKGPYKKSNKSKKATQLELF